MPSYQYFGARRKPKPSFSCAWEEPYCVEVEQTISCRWGSPVCRQVDVTTDWAEDGANYVCAAPVNRTETWAADPGDYICATS